MKVLKHLLQSGWNPISTVVNAATIIALIITHKAYSDWPFERTIFSLVSIALANLCIMLLIAYSKILHAQEAQKHKVTRMIQGEGFFKGQILIEVESSADFEVNQLLTMYCHSSGATQPICILQVVEKNDRSALCQFDNSQERVIRKYFEEEARRQSLYATGKLTQIGKFGA